MRPGLEGLMVGGDLADTLLFPRWLRKFGNTVIVDPVYGNDALGVRAAFPFATIPAALAAALSGDSVWVMPGTYELPAGITIPDGVSIRGASLAVTTIQMTGVVAATTLITMGESTRLEDVSLKLTSAANVTLTGIFFGGTTSATSKWRTSTLTVTHTGGGAANVTGVLIQSSGLPGREVNAARACTLTVTSNGTGTIRGTLQNSVVGNFSMRDVNMKATGTGAISCEIDIAGGVMTCLSGFRQGDPTGADISQTAGIMELGSIDLALSSANGKSFKTIAVSAPFVWGDDGALLGGVTRFMRPGTGTSAVANIQTRLNRATTIKGMSVRAAVGPGLGRTDVFTLQKNGVNTILTASLVDTATVAADDLRSVSFAAGDLMSMEAATNVATATTDVYVTVELY